MASTAISAQGLTFQVEVASTPTTIVNVNTFSQSPGESAEIDVTDFVSTSKEFLLGLRDNGEFSVDGFPDYADPAQDEIRALYGSGAIGVFLITMANGWNMGFNARVKSYGESGGVDDALRMNFALRVTGDVTRSPT
jgi:hypothetical protein